MLFLNETEFFNFYKDLLDRHYLYGYLGAKTTFQCCAEELASKTFITSNMSPESETSPLGSANYAGPLLMQFFIYWGYLTH